MQPLATALPRLEELKKVIAEYVPMMYESSDRTRELAEQIPLLYGSVEDVYLHFSGEQKVVVDEGRHKSTFRNFFEAGFLSGRTFHVSEGKLELERVVGRVRAEVTHPTPDEPKKNPVDEAWSLLHPRIQVIAQERFRSGHYADAVEAALKELASVVRDLVIRRGGPELDGTSLMQTAFSPKNPIIVLADLNTQSGKDMQRGYMDMFAGAMSAIRNPKAHGNVVITPERAIHLLFVASTLWFTLDERP